VISVIRENNSASEQPENALDFRAFSQSITGVRPQQWMLIAFALFLILLAFFSAGYIQSTFPHSAGGVGVGGVGEIARVSCGDCPFVSLQISPENKAETARLDNNSTVRVLGLHRSDSGLYYYVQSDHGKGWVSSTYMLVETE